MHYSQIKTIVLGTENLERWSQHKNDFFNCLAIPITHEPLSSQIASLQKYVTLCKNLESIVGLNDRAILIISLLENNQIQVLDAQTVVQFQHKESFLKLLSKLAIPIMNWQTISSTQEETIQLKFPFFIKPIRGAFSEKTGKIHSLVELKNHFSKYSVNEKIDPTIKKLFMCENTEHLNSYIIQEFVSAPQYTVDFYVRSGKVIIEAITESLIDSHYQSFIGFETPSLLPKECVQDLKNYIQKITTHLALPNAYFNVEFFVKDNQILIIEWNPRLSAQFLKMFEYSLGKNYLQSVLHLGQGEEVLNTKEEETKIAHIFVLRKKRDQVMQRTLSKSEVAVIEKKYDLLELKITALPNKKLSEVRQDSQSFRFGYATLAGSFLDRAATHRALQTELEALFLDS